MQPQNPEQSPQMMQSSPAPEDVAPPSESMPFEPEPDMMPDPQSCAPVDGEPQMPSDSMGLGDSDPDFGMPFDDDGMKPDESGVAPENDGFYEEEVEPGEGQLMPEDDFAAPSEPEESVGGEPEFGEPELGEPEFGEASPEEASGEPIASEPEEPELGETLPEAQEPVVSEPRDSAAEPEPHEEHKPEETPHNEENLHRDEKTTMDLVSDALQNAVNAPVKKNFRDAADMFKTLRNLSSSLPPVQKDAFFNSLNKLKLDYVIERLSGKPGLLSAASAIRKTGGIAGMKSDNKPSLLKTMSYMRTLINSLPDASQSWLLGKEVDKIINKAQR